MDGQKKITKKVSVKRQDQNNYSETEHIHSLDEDGFHDNMEMHVKWCFVKSDKLGTMIMDAHPILFSQTITCRELYFSFLFFGGEITKFSIV